jgi:hypothetical protein
MQGSGLFCRPSLGSLEIAKAVEKEMDTEAWREISSKFPNRGTVIEPGVG